MGAMLFTLLFAGYVLAVVLSYQRKGPLDRWYLMPRIPGVGRVFLHRMREPDDRPEVHNHPWPCFSIVLWGGYREMRWSREDGYTRIRRYRAGSIVRLPLHTFHRIFQVEPNTWTLFFHGRNTGRSWGFATARGFVRHDLMPAVKKGVRRGKAS